MKKQIKIGDHLISETSPTFIVAEMSGNHNMDFDRAVEIMKAAKQAGADAIKIQTYTADTITLGVSAKTQKTGSGDGTAAVFLSL